MQYMGAFIAYGLPDCSLMSALIKRRMENGGGGEEKVPCPVSASEKIFGSDADFLDKMYFSDNHSISISKESLLVLTMAPSSMPWRQDVYLYHLTIGFGFGDLDLGMLIGLKLRSSLRRQTGRGWGLPCRSWTVRAYSS